MPKPKKGLAHIPPLDLAYAVNRLIATGRVSAAEVGKLAGERSERIAALERELQALRGGAPEKPGRPAAPKPSAKKKKRKFTMTPKARAARKLQGKYLGLLKGLKGPERARVKAVAKKDGVAAAVKAAGKLAK